ncbi:hypothetical protein C9J12_05170 [Photobacterium frigidiphilum]|uniref:Lipoprotein n=1 Tax=Photobacterium frigidiphilum TaxID=264736 RepID=A0A2T3JM72_9GAMM|nr:hypothetical protein [Photobacterium frigidiphilum]PSU50133.1 hypothetical protein C9J12_05170 [Photobacterium frigidiphilum]
MKKQVQTLIIAGVLTSMLTGCGAVMQDRSSATQFDLQVQEESQNLDKKPVKSDVFNKVKTIVVADYVDYLEGFPADNIRVYKVMVKQLEKSLERSGKYKVISSSKFRDEIKRQDQDIDLTVDSSEDIEESMAIVGKALTVHGVVAIDIDTEGENISSLSNQATQMSQLIVDGEIRLPMEIKLVMVRTRTSEVLYSQSSIVDWVTGTSGLSTTKSSRLTKIVSSVVDPLVLGMTKTPN